MSPAPRLDLALLALALVWSVLLAARVAAIWLDPAWCTATAFAAVAVGLSATRQPVAPRTRRSALLLAVCVGAASHGLWLAAIAAVGGALGLPPVSAPAPVPVGALSSVSALVLAPVFEEMLYRERLLGALLPRIGPIPAIVLSSLAFALPHATAWGILGTFGVGLALGGMMRASRSVGVCVAYHVGLNAAGLIG